jgi:hypothetical protein
MLRPFRICAVFGALLIIMAACPLAAQPTLADSPYQLFLPLVTNPAPPNPFGFDLNAFQNDSVIPYVQNARPRWARAGEVLWSSMEPVRGGPYRWEGLAAVEANIRRLRASGIEPTLIVQQSPSWAQLVPGRLCSPMKPENIADFTRFLSALVARYADGPLKVNYWEFWNEPDHGTSRSDSEGVGCWADPALPGYGGTYYGTVLKQIYPVIKNANPNAVVLAGALAYFMPNDIVSRSFLQGMLSTGAGNSFDVLSFHAYGEWGAGDLLLSKTVRIRQILASYQLADKPLMATETAATCYSNTSCPLNFPQAQANYAARIYAEAIALNLEGAFWFTLANTNPGFAYSQLIDQENGQLVPRSAYYSFLNSSLLLNGARYTGAPIQELTPDQISQVQVLTFAKPKSIVYVMWVPKTSDGFPQPYNLPVWPFATAICTDHLDRTPFLPYEQGGRASYVCSDTNGDGMIPRAVGELPMYVEVFF